MWCVTTSVNWTKIVYLTRKLQVILLRCVRIFNKDLAVHSSLLPVPGLLQHRPWLRKKTQGLGKRDYSWHANQFPIGKLIFIKLRTRTDGHSRSIILTAPTGSPISPSSAWRSSIVVSIRFELRLCRRPFQDPFIVSEEQCRTHHQPRLRVENELLWFVGESPACDTV